MAKQAAGPKARKSTPDKPAAPSHLQPATKKWWVSVYEEFELEAHHLRLLTLAAEAWDRCVQARNVLAKQGLTYHDRFEQPRVRPEVAIERDSRIAFARLLRELSLDVDSPAEEYGRPNPRAKTGR
jgi:phage terminase small subunit